MSKDLRAYILRKHFQFLIVPMLNPDGVYYGFYRMDTMANNLNRFYAVCDAKQYLSIIK
jgi:murein tripeptide amidase MpaA